MRLGLAQAHARKIFIEAVKEEGLAFVAWREHLGQCLGAMPAVEDHGLTHSLYFSDPDGNPYEITKYEHAAFRAGGDA